MRFQFSRVVVVGLASLSLAACGGGGDGRGGPSPPASVTIVAGNGQTGEVGTLLPVALTVRVTDSAGRPHASVAVGWAVTAGSGAVNPPSGVTDSAGNAITRWTLGTTAGSQQVTATVAGLAPVAFSATAVAGNATASVTLTSPTTTPYEGDTVQLTAIARDQFGNALPDKVATWSSSNPTIAPVSASGVLQTWGTGDVTVVATVDGVRDQLTLKLTPILVTVAVGAKEVVFDYTTDRCDDLDLPDQPARFVRAEDASLVLIDGNAPRHYLSRGADFNSLRRVCNRAALVSADLRTAESYENWEWLWVVYRVGTRWHALIHNEFHDAVSSTCRVGDPSPGNPCWYNSITYAVSDDGVGTFVKPSPPQHVVAPPPDVWVPPPPGVPPPGGYYYADGYRAPTNLVRAGDGYYYSLIELFPSKFSDGRGLCVMRTDRLDDPASWRAWDGSGFGLRMMSPYVTGSAEPMCTFLSRRIDGLGGGHVVYSTYLSRYILVAPTPGWVDGRNVCGYFFSLSTDLIHWSEPRLLAEAKLIYCPAVTPDPGAVETLPTLYPSLVDHADTTVNFERAGRTPYLYYTRFNDGGLDRDLVRVPLTLTRTN